jgi:pantoate--beta-alanine ligase
MAESLFLVTEIVPCPIVREASGLAMSSRNTRLSPAGRDRASAIYRAISMAADPADAVTELESAGFKVEYVEDYPEAPGGPIRRLAAVWLEGVRLIDNVALGVAPASPDGTGGRPA